MPMDFPDLPALLEAAKVHRFRGPMISETERLYRIALAAHVQARGDIIEAHEIRTSRGHDKWTQSDELAMLANNFPRQ
jgi:hypothetical protein